MSNFSTQNLTPEVEKRTLAFINQVRDAKALLEYAPKSSAQPTGNWIGEKVASRIIGIRNAIPGRRLKSLEQLNDIQGFGQDKFDELIAMFQVEPSEAFRLAMYNGVILENWILKHETRQIDGDQEFLDTARIDCILKDYVADELSRICEERFNNKQAAQIASRTLNGLYIERFKDAHLASYALAFWFYKIDMDNWFSFETVRQKAEHYLSAYPDRQDQLELCFFKGFNPKQILNQPLTTMDLPVVINYAERRISIWSVQLND